MPIINQETQNVEFKRIWKDDYLKWICGFANANGGKIYLGYDDNGQLIGLADIARLMEDIPNKIRDTLGIIADVNLLFDNQLYGIEIVIAPYTYPINYKGQYHYRSGSTKQELKGSALDKFLLTRLGRHWDGVPLSGATIMELKAEPFDMFKNMTIKSQRADSLILDDDILSILERLHLLEDNYLKRAAILLFHPNPEKYISGAYLKIGFFYSDDNLIYQDKVHGNLLEQAEKSIDLLLSKYLKAVIHYEGLQRIEEYPLPQGALREALLNALVHKDYSGGSPIQISVYPDKLIIWNEGQLPEKWTVADLENKHPSKPYHPDIANAFFRAGLIESWGRGTNKIFAECKNFGLAQPIFSSHLSGLQITFNFKSNVQSAISSPISSPIALFRTAREILKLIAQNPQISTTMMGESIGISKRAVLKQISELKQLGILERVGSTKSGSWRVINYARQ